MLLQFDGTFIVIGVSFIIFMLIMQIIFYGPMFKIKKQRQDYIEENDSHAKAMTESAEGFIQKRDEELHQTRTTSKEIISKVVQEANIAKQTAVKTASEKASESLAKAKEQIDQNKQAAKESLSNEVYSLADDIVSKILD